MQVGDDGCRYDNRRHHPHRDAKQHAPFREYRIQQAQQQTDEIIQRDRHGHKRGDGGGVQTGFYGGIRAVVTPNSGGDKPGNQNGNHEQGGLNTVKHFGDDNAGDERLDAEDDYADSVFKGHFCLSAWWRYFSLLAVATQENEWKMSAEMATDLLCGR